MVRTMIESLLTDKSGYGKRTLRKDIGNTALASLDRHMDTRSSRLQSSIDH